MGVESALPQIRTLRESVEAAFGKVPAVHSDFTLLAADIENRLKIHISDSTLERVWNYSTRGYSTISLYTLDVLCRYCGAAGWQDFLKHIESKEGKDSGFFDDDTILTENLKEGDKIRIGWQPNRVCTVRYLGCDRFIAEECEHSTMRPGDTFTCREFQLHLPLHLHGFCPAGKEGPGDKCYVAGKTKGLSLLKRL